MIFTEPNVNESPCSPQLPRVPKQPHPVHILLTSQSLRSISLLLSHLHASGLSLQFVNQDLVFLKLVLRV